MSLPRQTMPKALLETRLLKEIERRLAAAGIDDTPRPIVVTELRGTDETGSNWTVSFVEGGEVTPHIVAGIEAMRARFNIG